MKSNYRFSDCMTSKESVIQHLDEVEDPELEISIVELGLVYDVRIESKGDILHAEIDMTLTSPGCPAAAELWLLLIVQHSMQTE